MTVEINGLDDANEVTIENDGVVRIQGPAPTPTRYVWREDGHWMYSKAGWATADVRDAGWVRQLVSECIDDLRATVTGHDNGTVRHADERHERTAMITENLSRHDAA